MAKKKNRNTLTYETLPALFTGICDAIRSKTGQIGLINHQNIPDAISEIVTDDHLFKFETVAVGTYAQVGTKSYTIAEAGNYNIMVAQTSTYDSSTKINVSKNGTTVNPTYSSGVTTPFYFKCCMNISCEAGDTIAITLPNTASLATNVIIIITKVQS